MPEERRCPACGASVEIGASFCGGCDSLVSTPTDGRTEPEPPMRRNAATPPEPRTAPPPPVPVVPSRTIDCWSCDAPNTASRMFCVNCGSFIAIGSRARPSAASEPFSGPPPVPGDADADVSLPFVEGVAPLGSYSMEAQRRATRRTRTVTAAASVVLATVVGAAALYLASPLSQRGDGVPETAVVAAPVATPQATERTGMVSGISIEPEVAAVPQAAVEPEAATVPEAAVEREAANEPEAAADIVPEPEPILEPIEPRSEPDPQPEPIEVAAEPAAAAQPEPVVAAQPDPEARPDPGPDEAVAQPSGYDGGWVCGEEITIEDSSVREWSLGRVSFRVRGGFERVVLHLQRAGSGSGPPASITADSMGSWNVKGDIPGADRPGLGRRSVALQLDNGFSGSLGLRGYRPSGLDIIKEFSVYPSGRDGRKVVISADTDGCYRVRVPAWNDPSGSVRRAEILVDIKP